MKKSSGCLRQKHGGGSDSNHMPNLGATRLPCHCFLDAFASGVHEQIDRVKIFERLRTGDMAGCVPLSYVQSYSIASCLRLVR